MYPISYWFAFLYIAFRIHVRLYDYDILEMVSCQKAITIKQATIFHSVSNNLHWWNLCFEYICDSRPEQTYFLGRRKKECPQTENANRVFLDSGNNGGFDEKKT